jgi:Uncharacterized protein conserved in bacteria (DUF2059)
MAMVIGALILAAAAAAGPAPGAEAERLGRELAGQGTLAALLPLIAAKETEELVAAHPELGEAEKAALRDTARATFAAGESRLLAATGHSYAERLTVAQLRRLVAFNRTEAARRYRAAMPEAIAASMRALGPIDFKADALAAFCRGTGKLCAGK